MVRKARAGTEVITTAKKSRNQEVIQAIVLGGKELVEKEDVEESDALNLDPFETEYSEASQIISPPLNLFHLSQLKEYSSELGQCVEAMVINIDGFGGRPHLIPMTKEQRERYKDEIEAERKKLNRFLRLLNPRDNLTQLKMKQRDDRETTGNAYWELVPPAGDRTRVAAIYHLESHSMRICQKDKTPTARVKKIFDPDTGETVDQTFQEYFRRFVQMRAGKKVYFKEWGDPRIIDKNTGRMYASENLARKAGLTEADYGHAVLHFRIFNSCSPYGLPRFAGNLITLYGSRSADEINYNTLKNNNIPSMVITVSGNAMLTEGTIKRIEAFSNEVIKKSANHSKFLLLEAEPSVDASFANSGTAKIDITPLKENQHNDQLFQEYDKNNADKIRRSFRLPPIFVGKTGEVNRATADAAMKLAEEQIFSPEREEMDRVITSFLEDLGYKFWGYKSFSPNVTNDEDIVKILSGTEKTGAVTPNMARKLISDVLNQEPELYDKETAGFDPDIPFSLTMAEAVKGANAALGGSPTTGALAPNQGQIPKPKREIPGVPTLKLASARAGKPTKRNVALIKEWTDRLGIILENEAPEEE